MLRACAVISGLVLLLTSGCARRWEGTPQIEVSPGAAQRAALIGRASPPPPKKTAGPVARAHARARVAADALAGRATEGKAPEWWLSNDEIVVVASKGALVAAADAKAKVNELERFVPASSLTGLTCDDGAAREEDDGTARVTFACNAPGLRVQTVYALARADRALLVTSTLTAVGEAPVAVGALADEVSWGALRPFAPGRPSPHEGELKAPFVGGVGAASSLAYTSTEGRVESTTTGARTEIRVAAAASLAPGNNVQSARVIAVGERADSASLITELTRASGGEVGTLRVSLVDTGGAAGRIPAGASVALSVGTARPEIMRVGVARASEQLSADVPVGRYEVWMVGPEAAGKRIRVEVRKGMTTKIELPAPTAAPAP